MFSIFKNNNNNNNELLKYYNKDTCKLVLPKNFSGDLNRKNLPKGIKEIKFEKNLFNIYNRSIDDLPDSIIKLSLHETFNLPIKKLPSNLKKLKFGEHYNQPINNIIFSKNLISITFGSEFNQSIDNLPDSVEHITLGCKYNIPISKYPKSINSLRINSLRINRTFFDNFSSSIENSINNLPDTITELILTDIFFDIIKLPKNLVKLSLPNNFNKKICQNTNEEGLLVIPKNVTYLRFGDNFNQSLDDLPPYVEEILVGENFNKVSTNLPISIKKITIRNKNQLNLFPKIPFECKIIIEPTIKKGYIGMSMFTPLKI